MKTIILVFLLSVMAFGQSGKSNLTQQQKDSINAMIGTYLDTAGVSGNYTLSGVVREVGADREYTTISSAITAASSGDIIKVFSGTYTEQITVSKNLTFDLTDNAILDYTTNASTGTVVVNSGITAKFIGGEIKRTTNTSGASVIYGAGNLELYDTKLTTSSTAALAYHLYLTDGTIKTDNIYCSNPYYNGAIILNSVTGYINAKQLLGHLNADSSQVSIESLNWFQKYYGGTNGNISGDSKIILSVKDYWGRIPASGNLDSLRNAQAITTTAGVELTIQDGIFNFEIYPAGNHTINLINVHCDEGEPAIRFTSNGSNPTAYWNVKGCDLTYSFPSFMDTTQYGGDHIFEANSASGDTNTVYLEIDNSTFRFGDKTVYEGVNDTARFEGNIFQMGFKGWIKSNNSTFIQYPEDNANLGAYDFFGNITGECEISFTNNVFINHSQYKSIWMISLTSVYYHKTIFFNNTFYNLNPNEKFSEVFFINDLRDFSVNDTIIVEGSTVYLKNIRTTGAAGGKSSGLFYINAGTAKIKTYYDNLTLLSKQQNRNLTVDNKLYTKGFSHPLLNQSNVLSSDGFALIDGDTLARAGVDGDSLRITIYPKYPMKMGTQVYGHNKTDISMTLYANRYSSNAYTTNSFWDVRLAWVGRSIISGRQVYFNATKIMEHATEPCTLTVAYDQALTDGTDFQYISFVVSNNNAFPLEIYGYIRQSLNFGNIVLTRF